MSAKVVPGEGEMGRSPRKLEPMGSPPHVGDQSATSDTSSGCLTLTADGKVLMDVSQLKQLLISNGGERQVLLQLNEPTGCSIGPLGPRESHKDNKGDQNVTVSFRWGGDAEVLAAVDGRMARRNRKQERLAQSSALTNMSGTNSKLEEEDTASQQTIDDIEDAQFKEFTEKQKELRAQIEVKNALRQRQQSMTAGAIVFLYYAVGIIYYTQQEDWTFINALYFVTVTLTTVGYGDLLPTTDGAKIFTCCFVLVGMFLVASALGVIAGLIIERLEALDDDDDGQDEDCLSEPWATLSYSAALLGGSVVVGTIFYGAMERDDFNFVDALYMSVITATTVGYGDYSPQTEGGRVFAVFWLLGAVICTGKAIGDVADLYATRAKALIEERRLKRNVTIQDLKEYGGDDGKLDKNEFALCKLRAMSRISRKDLTDCAEQFQLIDHDGGGVIDQKDVIHYGLEATMKALAD